MTTIKPESIRLCLTAELPPVWASVLGRDMAPELGEEELRLLQERVVSLEHGVLLAHIRTDLVKQPSLGVYKALDPDPQQQAPWLWMVVLVPKADASRHLGWMAHLAASLHDNGDRQRVHSCNDADALHTAVAAMLADHTHHYTRQPSQVVSAAAAVEPAVSHRMIIAILKEVEYVDHLLRLFVDHDVRGATILEARGMAEHLSTHMSLFAGFKSAFKAVGHSQVIISLVPSERTAEVLELVRIAAGGMETPGSGIAFALDVPAVIGLEKNEGPQE